MKSITNKITKKAKMSDKNVVSYKKRYHFLWLVNKRQYESN